MIDAKEPQYIYDCPLAFDWCEYKGEVFFGGINYHQSIKSKRAMVDLFYCATQAINGNVLKTVQWSKDKFNLNPTRNR